MENSDHVKWGENTSVTKDSREKKERLNEMNYSIIIHILGERLGRKSGPAWCFLSLHPVPKLGGMKQLKGVSHKLC